MDFSWLDPSLRLTKRQVSTYVLVLTSSMYAQLLSVDNESDADIEQREQAIEQAIEWKASASYLLTPRFVTTKDVANRFINCKITLLALLNWFDYENIPTNTYSVNNMPPYIHWGSLKAQRAILSSYACLSDCSTRLKVVCVARFKGFAKFAVGEDNCQLCLLFKPLSQEDSERLHEIETFACSLPGGSDFRSYRFFSASVIFSKHEVNDLLTLLLDMLTSFVQTKLPIPLVDLTTNDSQCSLSEPAIERACATPLRKNDVVLITFCIRRVTLPPISARNLSALGGFQWLRWKTFFEAEKIGLLCKI